MTQILRDSILELLVGFAMGDLSLLIPGPVFVEVQLDLPCFLNCLSGSNCWPLPQSTFRLPYHMFKSLPHICETQGNFGILQKTEDLSFTLCRCYFSSAHLIRHHGYRRLLEKCPALIAAPVRQTPLILLLLLSDSPITLCVLGLLIVSDSLQSHGLQAPRLLRLWNFPGKNTGVGCHFLLQGIFPTQGSNPCLLGVMHWQADSFPLHLLVVLSFYRSWHLQQTPFLTSHTEN